MSPDFEAYFAARGKSGNDTEDLPRRYYNNNIPSNEELEKQRIEYAANRAAVAEEKRARYVPGLCLGKFPDGTEKEQVQKLFEDQNIKEIRMLFPSHKYAAVYFFNVPDLDKAMEKKYFFNEKELEILERIN
eukprot:TRINITY_DN1489_c0_g1_i2.p1 TRINITY_DN1489_c0_g1~~TRINITY_DN1489_c0_g1_i2.p1  ORF type:complete len:132 (-),score=24.89 TRINITY_DN1489_c0_g1_i2:17-412(-)